MIGKTIFQYRIVTKLGQGGMGQVYKAEDLKLGRPVVFKFLHHHLADNQEAKERFVQEARAASALDHPNICTIYEINETDDGQLYIMMAYYEGWTLKEMIAQGCGILPAPTPGKGGTGVGEFPGKMGTVTSEVSSGKGTIAPAGKSLVEGA
ncbi:protein kinase, partial [candidate division KSB1 bacterium]|nr:protein kinase [candidate division KSB1 bacterium]